MITLTCHSIFDFPLLWTDTMAVTTLKGGGRGSQGSPATPSSPSTKKKATVSTRSNRKSTNDKANANQPPSFSLLRDEQDEPPNPCRGCSEIVQEGVDAIQCDRCKTWVHAYDCSGLLPSEYKMLQKSKCSKLKYFCSTCDVEAFTQTDPDDKLAQHTTQIETLTCLVGQTLQMQKSQKQQNEMILSLLKNEGRLEEKIKVQVSEVLDEKTEKDARQNSIIVFNIPEGDEGNPDKAASEDIEKLKGVFNYVAPEVPVDSLTKPNIIRLGKPRVPTTEHPIPKPRPIKITLKDPSHRVTLVNNSRKLKNYAPLQKIGITGDKTKNEREADKKAKEEFLQRKKEKSEDETSKKAPWAADKTSETHISATEVNLSQDSQADGSQ